MRMCRRILGYALAIITIICSLPIQSLGMDSTFQVYEEESVPTEGIGYDDFSNTENLQLNGDALVDGNVIQFDSSRVSGESVFTKEKITLGGDKSFSTGFTFRNISPADPIDSTKGGFAYTLQPNSNAVVPSGFQDLSMSSSLSIAFISDYFKEGIATMSTMSLDQPMRTFMSAVVYINGDFENPIEVWNFDSYSCTNEVSDDYKIWIGYDGAEKTLHLLCLTPSGLYMKLSTHIDLDELWPTSNEVYGGFTGSLGDAGNVSIISSWYMKDDVSLLDEAIVKADLISLTSEIELLEAEPVGIFFLPLYGQFGSNISWESSNTNIVTEDGIMIPLTIDQEPQTVTLKATIRKGASEKVTRDFNITVEVQDYIKVEADLALLDTSLILEDNDSVDSIVSDLYLPTIGQYGSTISWLSSNALVVDSSGYVTRPSYFTGDENVTLTAYISLNGVLMEKTFDLTVKSLGIADNEAVEADWLWLSPIKILNGNSELDHITKNLSLPMVGQYGSVISWLSSNEAIIDTYGTVTRPNPQQGDQIVTLTATINSNGTWREKEFTVIVKVSDEDIVSNDYSWLTDTVIRKDNKGLNHVITDLNLPSKGYYNSTISWTSSNPNVISVTGYVLRVYVTEDSEEVTLTATIRMGDALLTKEFTATVRGIGWTDDERIEADKSWLSAEILLNGNSSLDMVTSNLSLPNIGGVRGCSITWESSNINVVDLSGLVTRASYSEGDKTVVLTATISIEDGTNVTKTFTITVKALEQADEEWLNDKIILGENINLTYVTENLSLPSVDISGKPIIWTSSDIKVIDTNGVVTRPTYTEGNKEVVLTALLTTEAGETVTKTFRAIVIHRPQTDAEKIVEAFDWLTEISILGENSSREEITGNVVLPSIYNGVQFIWESSNPSIVSSHGYVTRPRYHVGDVEVTLTATLKIGSEPTLTKSFTLVVKATEKTQADMDRESVDADYNWLVNSVILNGNSDFYDITRDLYLPTEGENGSNIIWQSNLPHFIDEHGKVTRPGAYELDVWVTLTAKIVKGISEKEKSFTLNVRRLPVIPEEHVALDYEWLTADVILNGNSSLDQVTTNLHFPSEGPKRGQVGGSKITWESSHHGFVTITGNVYRPMYHVGDMTVTLTATITFGSASMKKTFTVNVKHNDLTDEESVKVAANWINSYNTLGGNSSNGSIVENLNWPTTGLYDTTITWESSFPKYISNEGIVTRPEHGVGNIQIEATATITKGTEQEIVTIYYIVLQKSDMDSPVVMGTTLGDRSTNILWNTKQIVITYNEDIVLADRSKIVLAPQLNQSLVFEVEKNKLVINLLAELSGGENRLIIPAGAITDKVGNPTQDYVLTFNAEEKIDKEIELLSSSIVNNQKNVDPNTWEITLQFDHDDLVASDASHNKLYMGTHPKIDRIGKLLSINYTLSGDKVIIRLLEPLIPGESYYIKILDGFVKDRFLNKNRYYEINFNTKGNETPTEVTPIITNIYPSNGETGVSIKPNIEIDFLDIYEKFSYGCKLTDSSGKEYQLYSPYRLDHTYTKLIFIPKETLKPNTVYTFSGPYSMIGDLDGKDFSIQFKTGSGPRVTKSSPSTGDWNANNRGIVELYFDQPIKKGDQYHNIVFCNQFGDAIDFISEEVGNKVILRSKSELLMYDSYTVFIPEGAYTSLGGQACTQYRLTFYTNLERLTNGLMPEYLGVDDIGFVGKDFKLSSDTFEINNMVNYIRTSGYGPVSYEWYVDDELVGDKAISYYNFTYPGEYKVTLRLKDKYGYTYDGSKTVIIKTLNNVEMSLHNKGQYELIYMKGDKQQDVTFSLYLEQENRFVYGERIKVKLYKDGVLQRLSNLGDGGITITSNYGDNAYTYTYQPVYGAHGTYEMEFTYSNAQGEQVIRQPFNLFSMEPATTDVIRFRLYNKNNANYFEELSYVYVTVNGERLRANKETYTYNGTTIPVYVLQKTLLTNTYYDIKMDDWQLHFDTYNIGKDTSNPLIFTGYQVFSITNSIINIGNMAVNEKESDLKDWAEQFFIGMPTKITLDVEGNWGNFDIGYYEIAALALSEGANRDAQTELRLIYTQAHNPNSKSQKIVLQPGLQIKDNEEYYYIRMVSPQGYKSDWKRFEQNIDVLPKPELLGKKLSITIKDGYYVLSWPTVFDGPVGGVISKIDDIPLLEGGSFGLGGSMPSFDGSALYPDYVELTFSGSFGYGSSSTKKEPTKYKKVKKVTVIGYDFEIELEGGLKFYYDWDTSEWSIDTLYFSLYADLVKRWDKGFDILGVGFTAGVYVGSGFSGTIKLVNDEDWKYSGIIGLSPYAGIHADVDLKVAKVWGDLTARLPAEFHFPTGYIGADITVKGGIYAKSFLYTGPLYENDFYNFHWDNGKEMVTVAKLGVEPDKGRDIDFKLMGRDYAQRQSKWIGGYSNYEVNPDITQFREFQYLKTQVENANIRPLMENIYPSADLALSVNGDQRWMVWNDDNLYRDPENRTQLRLANYKDGVWSDAGFIYDDGTADFTPSVATVDNGILMAWNNIGRVITETEGISEMLANAEISVTENTYTAKGTKPNYITLTHDDKIDHSPRLVSNGEKALLIWSKSEELGLHFDTSESSTTPSDYFYFSTWNEGIWSTAEMIPMDPATILDSYLVMEGDKALLLYTRDMDDDLLTGDDREVFAIIYDGSTWGEPIQLTDNFLIDYSPKAVWVNGDWFLTWIQAGKIVYQIGLDGATKEGEWLENIQSDYQITVNEGVRPLVTLVYTQLGKDNALDIYGSFYDFNNAKWSDKKELKVGNSYTENMSSAFTTDGKLLVAYTQADIITEAKPYMIDGKEELIEDRNISDKVDLEMLTYTPTHDMALLDEEGILLSTEYPIPGTVTTVYTTVHNQGDFAENVVVTLFDGDPKTGGVKVAESAPQLMEAHSSKEVEIKWLVGPEEKIEYELYAVVQISDGVEEINKNNNQLSLKVITSDIAITTATCENVGADDYLIDVTVANRGSKVLENIKVWLEEESGEKIQEIGTLQSLDLGEVADLSYMIQSNGRSKINVRVILQNEGKEGNESNNLYNLLLKPGFYTVKSLNIAPGAEQVALDSSIILEFNMPISKGKGFEQIKLFDQELNEVTIIKIVTDNTLKIQPQQLLEQGTRYRLEIPVDALGDSYGHTLEKGLRIAFTTITTSPEIVSSYPSNGMNGFALNAPLYLRYNQTIVKNSDAIVLREQVDGAEAREIPIDVSVDGELLTIKPYQKLTKNGAYTLEVSRGVVENQNGETSQKDYSIRFIAAEKDSTNSGGNQGEEPSSDQGEKPSSNYQYEGSLHLGNVNKSIAVIVEDGKATLKLGQLANELFSNNQNAVLEIPHIPNVSSYTFNVQGDVLASSSKATLTINTAMGSIIIPANMLENMDNMSGKTVEITMSSADKYRLLVELQNAIGNRPMIQLSLTINGIRTDWNNPQAPVRVLLPYTPTVAELEKLEGILIWSIDNNGNVVTMPNSWYRQSSGVVSFSTTHFSDFVVAYNQVEFNDVPTDAWYSTAVSFIADRGITAGTGNNNFSPGRRLTRGQYITMIMKAYGLEPDKNPVDNYSDADNTWYTGYVAAAKRLGISKGVGNNMFAPEKEITRQEMFTLLYNMLVALNQLPTSADVTGENSIDSTQTHSSEHLDFLDKDEIEDWAREAIITLVKTGVIIGSSGKIMPRSISTRAEMAQVIYKLMTR